MKNIWLMGGFGNVLFQILAYRVVSKSEDIIKINNILTERNLVTKLLGWTIHERLYDDFIDKNDINNNSNIFIIIIVLILSNISKITRSQNSIATFYSVHNQLKKPYARNIFGYFQDKNFLEQNKDDLLLLGQEVHNKYKQNESHIVVHYRLGDSIWAREYQSYYCQIKKLVQMESETVYIATDSPKEALKFFSDCDNVKLTDSKNALDDFKYMVSAKKLYCAPSTFSWWAAHSLNNNSIAIMPSFFENTLGIYKNKELAIILDSKGEIL